MSKEPDADDNTESEAELSAAEQIEKTDGMSSDADDVTTEFSVEDAGMSAAEMKPDDSKTEAQEPSSTEVAQAPDDVSDEAKTDETNPNK